MRSALSYVSGHAKVIRPADYRETEANCPCLFHSRVHCGEGRRDPKAAVAINETSARAITEHFWPSIRNHGAFIDGLCVYRHAADTMRAQAAGICQNQATGNNMSAIRFDS